MESIEKLEINKLELLDLPNEIILIILSKCDIYTIVNIAQTNKTFRNIIRNTNNLFSLVKNNYYLKNLDECTYSILKSINLNDHPFFSYYKLLKAKKKYNKWIKNNKLNTLIFFDKYWRILNTFEGIAGLRYSS